MNLAKPDDRINALIRAEHADDPDGLNPARGIGWVAWAAVLVVIVGGALVMLVMLGVR